MPAPALTLNISVSGAQAVLATATAHVIRHSTAAMHTGQRWDRHLLANAIRDARQALDELEAALPAETNAEAA